VDPGFEIVVTHAAPEADRRELEERLNEFNRQTTGFHDDRGLSCIVRDSQGRLIAGIDGFTWGGYARIDVLWVEESRRGLGLGRRLVEAVEQEALTRGCTTIVLTSHEFQAPGFYERLGYSVVGQSSDTPRGYRELLFEKRLDQDR